MGPSRVLYVATALSLAFYVLFFCGLSQTVMSLEVAKSLPPFITLVLKYLGLKTEDLESSVNVFNLIHGLAKETGEGKVTSLVGFIMFVVFVIGMTLVDMLALMCAAIATYQEVPATRYMKFAWFVKKLSMVDVMCMGASSVFSAQWPRNTSLHPFQHPVHCLLLSFSPLPL